MSLFRITASFIGHKHETNHRGHYETQEVIKKKRKEVLISAFEFGRNIQLNASYMYVSVLVIIKLNGETSNLVTNYPCVIITFSTLDMPIGTRVGTRRYLPPEILLNEINAQHFEAFRRADIYSFALVIWEICSRTMHDPAGMSSNK